uniref:Ig-like domain-containing protein n=1 Tax=Stegastes partitus TaxID=144197 RepID=A0A3B4ZP10_9TELE
FFLIVLLMASFSLLFPGLIAGDTISPGQDEVSGTEGQSVTLSCNYEADNDGYTRRLYWYKHHSDLQAPQFILWKGAKGNRGENIPDKGKYESQTSATSTTLTIRELTLADTALYYCAVEKDTHGESSNHLTSEESFKWPHLMMSVVSNLTYSATIQDPTTMREDHTILTLSPAETLQFRFEI